MKEILVTLWRGEEFIQIPIEVNNLTVKRQETEEEIWRKSGHFKSSLIAISKKTFLAIQNFDLDSEKVKHEIKLLENQRIHLVKKGNDVTRTTQKIDLLYREQQLIISEKNKFQEIAKLEIENIERLWSRFEDDAAIALEELYEEEGKLQEVTVQVIKQHLDEGYMPDPEDIKVIKALEKLGIVFY